MTESICWNVISALPKLACKIPKDIYRWSGGRNQRMRENEGDGGRWEKTFSNLPVLKQSSPLLFGLSTSIETQLLGRNISAIDNRSVSVKWKPPIAKSIEPTRRSQPLFRFTSQMGNHTLSTWHLKNQSLLTFKGTRNDQPFPARNTLISRLWCRIFFTLQHHLMWERKEKVLEKLDAGLWYNNSLML